MIGQPLAVRLLKQAAAGSRLSHAYLFAGPDGVGKRRVALELAKSLTCKAPGPDGDACDHCTACRKIDASPPTHPDLRLVEPETRMIKTDQVRELQAEMYARPVEGKARIAIINGAEKMNPEAANRLLKLLEEPPAYAVLLLLTANLAGVLPTLISRSQIIHFTPLAPEQVAGALTMQAGVAPGQARVLAELSGGSLGRAMAMAGDPAVTDRRAEALALLNRLHEMDDFDALGEAEKLEKQREQLDGWLEMLTFWLRDALLVAETGSDRLVINTDQFAAVRSLAERLGSERVLQMLDAVTDLRGQLQRNVNVRLALDLLVIRLTEAARP